MSYLRFIGKVKEKEFILEDEELHHAKVRRVKVGEYVEINDLQGNVYLGVIKEITKKKIIGQIIDKLREEDENIKINLYLCMPNHLSKVDDLIEPMSQLGVYSLIPVISKYTSVKEKDISRKIKKWEKIAINSIKQCKRLFPLKIEQPVKLPLLKPEGEKRFVFYEKEKEKNMKNFLGLDAKEIDILIGGEGGLSEEEIITLKTKGFETISLGKNILKMETAVITAVCQVKFVFD